MNSEKFSLNKEDIKRVSLHILWYGIGAFLITVINETLKLDLGEFKGIAQLIGGAIVDTISRYIAGK